MGIKGLNKFLEKNKVGVSNGSFFEMDINQLSNKKIAIDASIIMYKHMFGANKKIINGKTFDINNYDKTLIIVEWIKSLLSFVCKWVPYKIIPVFVFDGKPGLEKKATIDDRKLKKQIQKQNIDDLYKKINDTNGDNKALVFELKEELIKYIDITYDHRILYKEILKNIGIPCIDAIGEAEKLCCMLCKDNYVSAVYSHDIDVMAYGCPLIVKGFSKNNKKLLCVSSVKVIEALNITDEMFLELCIMCGCDYNKNIKGLGPGKSYKLLLKHKTIDNMPFDVTALNHMQCRESFKYIESKDLIASGDINNITIDTNYVFNPSHVIYLNAHINKILSYHKKFNTNS